jgi:hypothetical protein
MLTLFNPGDLQSLHFLEREGPNTGPAGETTTSLLAVAEVSYANRAIAIYRHYVASPNQQP